MRDRRNGWSARMLQQRRSDVGKNPHFELEKNTEEGEEKNTEEVEEERRKCEKAQREQNPMPNQLCEIEETIET